MALATLYAYLLSRLRMWSQDVVKADWRASLRESLSQLETVQPALAYGQVVLLESCPLEE